MSSNETSIAGQDDVTRQETTMDLIGEKAKKTANFAAHYAAEQGQVAARHYVAEPAKDLLTMMKEYAREKPDVAACWCFGVGMLIGWKLKP